MKFHNVMRISIMDNIQEILTELDEFKGELSQTKEEKWQSNISKLLSSPDGITALQERLEPKVKITRSILRMLVSQIKSRFDTSEPVTDKDDLIRLLKLLSKNDHIDSDARWSALSVVLSTNESNSIILAEVLDKISKSYTVHEKYDEYAFDYMEPDGGFPYLLDLYLHFIERKKQKYEKWLPDLLEKVSKRLYDKERSIAQRSLRRLQLYLDSIKPPFSSMHRPLILLATKSPDTLHATLKSVSKKLSTEDSKVFWKQSIESRIEKILSGDVEIEPQLIQGEKAVDKKEEPASISTGLEDLRKLLIQILKSQQLHEDKHRSLEKQIISIQSRLEDRNRIDQLQREKAKLEYELKKTKQEEDEMIDELDRENNQLKDENAKLREELDKAQADVKKLREEKEAQAKKHEDRIREEKQFAEDKIQRTKNKADNLVSNFCDKLGRKLYPYFIEAKDESLEPGSKEGEILLNRLRDILRTLEKSGVAIA